MAAASPPPSWVVLSRSVEIARLSVDTEDQDAVVITCASRKAYGCGEHGQDLVNGVTLLARTVDYPNLTSSLSVRLTDAALGIVQAELGMGGEPLVQIGGLHGMDVRGAVHHAGENGLLVVVMFFSLNGIGGRDGYYYLVHDAVAGGSLSVIEHPPSQVVSTITPRALAVRRDGGGVDLLLVARLPREPEFPEQVLLRNDVVLCACPLGPPLPSSRGCCGVVGPWQLKKRRYGRDQAAAREPFSVNAAFSFDGQAFWADLARGVVRCDMRTAGDLAHHVDFDFICLPPGFELDSNDVTVTRQCGPRPVDVEIPVITFRTVGHDGGDTVAFVSLGHPGCTDPSKRMVTAWTLQHDRRRRRRRWWRRDAAFSVRSLWELESFKSAGLPETEPYCPVLMPDGALCFLLRDKCRRRREEDALDVYVCVLDMSSMSILWSARFPNHFTSAGPTLLPSDFFNRVHSPVPIERKLPSIDFTQD